MNFNNSGKLKYLLQDPIMRNNVQLRLYEKRILVSTVAVCEQKLKEVQSNN